MDWYEKWQKDHCKITVDTRTPEERAAERAAFEAHWEKAREQSVRDGAVYRAALEKKARNKKRLNLASVIAFYCALITGGVYAYQQERLGLVFAIVLSVGIVVAACQRVLGVDRHR